MKKTVIISHKADEMINLLRNDGYDIIMTESNKSVDERIADHADISFFFDGNDTLFVAKELSHSAEKLRKFCKNIIILGDNLGDIYPSDVRLNCVRLGNFFICNTNTVSQTILSHINKLGCTVIDVSQGYTKCSVVPVNNNSIITDDKSVADSCKAYGIDVLYISKGDVLLSGFSYGFIGGTAGLLSYNKLYFNGDISFHNNFKYIKEFLDERKVDFACVTKSLTDIGSIIPLYKIQE